MAVANDCLYKTIGPSEPYEFLTVYPHNAVPCHNLHANISSELNDGDAIYNASVLFKSFPFTATYPVPVYPPAEISRSGLNGVDPCLTLVKQKKAWENYKDVLLNSCDKSMLEDISSSDDFNENNEKFQLNVHPNVALLTKHIEKDPDQFFNATYNWYFSGSNIEIINVGDRKYLMRPNGSSGEILFSPLILHKNQWMPESESDDELKFNLRNSNPPCQVDAINNNVLVREKTRICHLMLKEDNDRMFIEQLCDVTGSVNKPFISASINKENVNEFCILTPNELLIRNVSLSSPVSKFNLNLEKDNSKDSSGYVHYMGAETILYADRKAVHIYDLRANNTQDQMTWPVNSLVDICEEISCCNVGSRNINYIGTNHHLLSLDVRQGWTQRWTHGITSSPTMIKILQRNLQEEFIFVASQRSDSVVLIHNECEDGNSNISRIHPYLLPSLRESLHLARYNSLCLDHLLTSRFSMSLTGLCCLEDRYINVIRCTSIGDIFWQQLRSAEYNDSYVSTNLSNDDIKKMEEFEFRCEEAYICSDKKCRVTSVKNTEKLIDYLYTSTCPVDESKAKTSINNKKLPSCKQLKTYRDYLAPVLLKPWNIDGLVGNSVGSDSSSQVYGSECDSNSDEECDVENAVSNWLNTYDQEMSTYIEYSVDEERSPNPNNSDIKENISEMIEHDEDRILSKQEMKTSDESSQNIFHNISSIENDSNIRNQCVRDNSFTKEKPVPTIKKKYISGF